MLWIGWRRAVVSLTSAPLLAFVAWWLVRLPPPPVESMIPVAPTSPATINPGEPSNNVWLAPLDTLAPARVAVHVVGAVVQPGVYHLSAGARADDALRAAGGASANADLRRVNLAAVVLDGEQLVIPRVGERVTASIAAPVGANPRASQSSATTVPLVVDLNRATVDDLDRLPGVGPATARAIIDHRTRNGPFASVDDLLAVRGIGPAKLAEIRPWVAV